MSLQENLNKTKEFFNDFRLQEPSGDVDVRILEHAHKILSRIKRKRLLLIAGTIAVAACLCFGVVKLFFPRNLPSPGRLTGLDKTIKTVVVSKDKTDRGDPLVYLSTFRQDCEEIDQMLEVIPSTKAQEKKKISEKLDKCLQKISQLENRVRFSFDRSQQFFNNPKEVRV